MLVGVWYLPEAQRWWIEAVAEAPQVTLGLLRAAVYRTERPAHPAAFSPRVAERGEVAPCGSICPDCEQFDRCARCPATLHYRAG